MSSSLSNEEIVKLAFIQDENELKNFKNQMLSKINVTHKKGVSVNVPFSFKDLRQNPEDAGYYMFLFANGAPAEVLKKLMALNSPAIKQAMNEHYQCYIDETKKRLQLNEDQDITIDAQKTKYIQNKQNMEHLNDSNVICGGSAFCNHNKQKLKTMNTSNISDADLNDVNQDNSINGTCCNHNNYKQKVKTMNSSNIGDGDLDDVNQDKSINPAFYNHNEEKVDDLFVNQNGMNLDECIDDSFVNHNGMNFGEWLENICDQYVVSDVAKKRIKDNIRSRKSLKKPSNDSLSDESVRGRNDNAITAFIQAGHLNRICQLFQQNGINDINDINDGDDEIFDIFGDAPPIRMILNANNNDINDGDDEMDEDQDDDLIN